MRMNMAMLLSYFFTAEPAENTESQKNHYFISALSVISAVNKHHLSFNVTWKKRLN